MDQEERDRAELFDELRVVTSAAWLARDLTQAQILPVVHDIGLDIPASTDRMAWWCAGSFAARLGASGVLTSFVGPTAAWQAALPAAAMRRRVHATTLGELRASEVGLWFPAGMFAKLADIKLSAVPARWWSHAPRFLERCAAAGLPDSTPVLVTGTRLDLVEEHRCFVTAGAVTASSVYRVEDRTWDSWEGGAQPDSQDAVRFATAVLADVGSQPPGWVLDVGRTREGDWVVVEANPSWCANPYHGDPSGVVRSVLAGQDPLGRARQWTWEPGEHMAARARMLPKRTATAR